MFKTTVGVEGMACAMCEEHVNNAFKKGIAGVKSVKSSHSKCRTEIVSETAPTEDEVKAILKPTGYGFMSYVVEEVPQGQGLMGKLKSLFG